MSEKIDYTKYPEGYEAIKKLIDWVPEGQKDMIMNNIMILLQK